RELARAAGTELLLDQRGERLEDAVDGLLVEPRALRERCDDLRLRKLVGTWHRPPSCAVSVIEGAPLNKRSRSSQGRNPPGLPLSVLFHAAPELAGERVTSRDFG